MLTSTFSTAMTTYAKFWIRIIIGNIRKQYYRPMKWLTQCRVRIINFRHNHKLENVFMKHYALNHMLAAKEGSSQKGV